jgi:hypothetical protein
MIILHWRFKKYKDVPGMIDIAVKHWGWKKGDFISQAIREYFMKTATLHQDVNALLNPAGRLLPADPESLQANVEALMPSIWDSPKEWSLEDNPDIYAVMTREQSTHLRLMCNYLLTQMDDAAGKFIGPIDELEKNPVKRLQSYAWFKALSEEEKKAVIEERIEQSRKFNVDSIKNTYAEFFTEQLANRVQQQQQQKQQHVSSSDGGATERISDRMRQWQELQNKTLDKQEKRGEEEQDQKVI